MKVPKLSADQISIINSILDKVKTHPQYNKSIQESVSSDLALSLNYHIHPNENTYCVIGRPIYQSGNPTDNLKKIISNS